jgi:hypothetical protein
MKKVALFVVSLTVLAATAAEAQTVRYYNSRGSSMGTSTTTSSGATTFYNSRGSVIGRSYRR